MAFCRINCGNRKGLGAHLAPFDDNLTTTRLRYTDRNERHLAVDRPKKIAVAKAEGVSLRFYLQKGEHGSPIMSGSRKLTRDKKHPPLKRVCW